MPGPQVKTIYGTLEGAREDTLSVFRGIPFAMPPVGDLRWSPPQKPEGWEGVKLCTEYSAVCTQELFPPAMGIKIMEVPGPQSEDCLYLNVWTEGCDDARRPVMVWIHGGGLGIGAASQPLYDGQHLARKGVTVVTINYRMAALGFLHLDTVTDGAIPATGNEGFLDQIAALEWVRDNIQGFGGDPDNVTVFGESAGSWSVTALMAMPRAKGLFHKAIAQSGVSNGALGLEHAADLGKEFLDDVTDGSVDADLLRALPGEKILRAGSSFVRNIESELGVGGENRYHQAVIDGEVLPAPVLESVASGMSSDVVLMAGTTRDEVPAMVPPGLSADQFEAQVSENAYGIDSKELIQAYREARSARLARVDDADVAGAIHTDAMMRIPCIRLLEAQRQHQPVYHYIVTWTTPTGDGAAGANHGIELGFVFGTYGIDDDHAWYFGDGPAAAGLANAMMDAWTNFAKTGNPSSETLGDWPEYGESRATMMIGERTHVVEAPFEDERQAWEKYDNSVLQRPPFELRNKG